MSNAHSQVEKNLLELIRDNEHRVISLKGKWGTGKTHLWQSIEEKLRNSSSTDRHPIYVSIFGAKTIDDLKMRILQNACMKNLKSVQKALQSGGSLMSNIFQRITGFSAKDAALVWLPQITSGRLVVIDDVERKHNQLDIDELLGFVDEYSESHQTRFLILLNSDQLGDNERLWKVLHEKVIDAELILSPSPSDCLEIACRGMAPCHVDIIRSSINILGITNIRVITRILKSISYIASKSELGSATPSRWIPSTVLLTASHYHAISNAPDLAFIMSHNRYSVLGDAKQENMHHLWSNLLDELGIRVGDEFEETIHAYLQTGHLDVAMLNLLAKRYREDERLSEFHQQWDDFYNAIWWDPQKTDEEIQKMAEALIDSVQVMSPRVVSDLVKLIRNFSANEAASKSLAEKILDAWIEKADGRPDFKKLEERIFDDPHQEIDPRVLEKLNEMRDIQFPPMSIVEAAARISKGGYSDRERIALGSSTVKQYEEALKKLRNDELRRFVNLHIKWLGAGDIEKQFKNGAENFLDACRNIHSSAPKSRFSAFIENIFSKADLADLLQ